MIGMPVAVATDAAILTVIVVGEGCKGIIDNPAAEY